MGIPSFLLFSLTFLVFNNHSFAITNSCEAQCSSDAGLDTDCYNQCSAEGLPSSGFTRQAEPSQTRASAVSAPEGTKKHIPETVASGSACATAIKKAENNCDINRNPETKDTMNLFRVLSGSLAMGAFGVCKQAIDAAKAANAALYAYDLNCKSDVRECISTCKAEGGTTAGASGGATSAETKKQIAACEEAGKQTNPQHLMVLMQFNTQSQDNCTKLQAALSDLSGSQIDPNDCTNQANLGNPVCTCKLRPDLCVAGTPIDGFVPPDTTNIGNTGTAALKASDFGDGIGGIPNELDAAAFKGTPTGLAGGPGGAAGRLSGGDSGPGGGKKGGPAGKPGAGNQNTFSSGGRPAGMFGTTSGGGGYGSGERQVFGKQFGEGGPDINKFLPANSYAAKRGLAGVCGPDGIKCSHTHIFKNMNGAYQEQGATFNP